MGEKYEPFKNWSEEDITCSVQQTKALRELGVTADASLWWVKDDDNKFKLWSREDLFNDWMGSIISELMEESGNLFEALQRQPDQLAETAIVDSITDPENEVQIPAFTSAELGAMLPETVFFSNNIPGNRIETELWCGKYKQEYFAGYFNAVTVSRGMWLLREFSDTEAKAKAKLLIHLVKFKHITANDALMALLASKSKP